MSATTTSPVQIRARVWQDMKRKLQAMRGRVYGGYLLHGPCTTRELAQKIGVQVLTVRPRTTELLQMGLLRCTGARDAGDSHEGIYEAVNLAEAVAAAAVRLDKGRVRDCPECGGSGRDEDDQPCDHCGGDGGA